MFEQQRIAMVDGQLRTNKITDPDVIDLFLTMPREEFAAPGREGSAYVDEEMDLGHGRVLLEPLVAARLLQSAELEGGKKVLVMGGGNGYMPRLLCDLGCDVTVIEPVTALANMGMEKAPEATWLVQDFKKLPADTFDLIVACGSLPAVPAEWSACLNEGGAILTPIAGERGNDGRLIAAVKSNGALSSRTLANASVPTLPEFTPAPMFEF